LIKHPYLVVRLRINGAIPLSSVCAFLMWTGETVLLPLFLRFVIDDGKSLCVFPDAHDKFVLATVVVGVCFVL
jgi:hypothetical protein